MAIFEEQVLEPFVGRGVGVSGVASRQIQAGNLPDLSAAVRQAQTEQQNLKQQRESASQAEQLINISSVLESQKNKNRYPTSVAGGDTTKPFVIGRFNSGKPGGGLTVAIPDERGGYTLQSVYEKNPESLSTLKSMGIDINAVYPELGIVGLGGRYSGNDLKSQIIQYSKPNIGAGSVNISDILNRISSGGSSDVVSGTKLKWADPTYPSRKREKILKEVEEKLRGERVTAAETKYTEEAKARVAAGLPATASSGKNPVQIRGLGGNLGLSSIFSNLTRNIARR